MESVVESHVSCASSFELSKVRIGYLKRTVVLRRREAFAQAAGDVEAEALWRRFEAATLKALLSAGAVSRRQADAPFP